MERAVTKELSQLFCLHSQTLVRCLSKYPTPLSFLLRLRNSVLGHLELSEATLRRWILLQRKLDNYSSSAHIISVNSHGLATRARRSSEQTQPKSLGMDPGGQPVAAAKRDLLVPTVIPISEQIILPHFLSDGSIRWQLGCIAVPRLHRATSCCIWPVRPPISAVCETVVCGRGTFRGQPSRPAR